MKDALVAILLFAATTTTLGLAQRTQGVMRDEGTYFQAAESYQAWLAEAWRKISRGELCAALSRQGITRQFAINNEHPVLLKMLFGVSRQLFHAGSDGAAARKMPPATRSSAGDEQARPGDPALPQISAFRLPAWLFAGLAVALLYLFGARIESRIAGLAAAALYITIPRVFFHAQLACFDSPMATMWLLVVYGYLRSLESARWGVLTGVFFGLALATKHNAWFIPALLLLHYLVVIAPDVSLRPLRLPRVPLVFLSMALLGPLVFLAHWPWLWFDTVQHLKGYFAFHLHHAYYNMEFLGRNYGLPPLPASYPFVMTLFTVPAVTLALTLAGLALYLNRPLRALAGRLRASSAKPASAPLPIPLSTAARQATASRRRSWLRPAIGLEQRLGWLLLLNALFPLVLIAMPSTPIFGGTKHWLPAYPFFALLGGVAIGRLAAALRAQLGPRRLVSALICALPAVAALPGALSIAGTHPFGLSQYSALAGGVAGGADLGLNRQFWGYATRQLLPYMNNRYRGHGRLYFHDTSYDSHRYYQRDGLLRPDVIYAGMERPAIDSSDYAVVIHELHFNKYDYWIWDAYGTAAPDRVLELDGVPLVSAYVRPGK